MGNNTAKLLRETARSQEISGNLPSLDQILLFALERQYLGLGEFKDIILEQSGELTKEDMSARLRTNVRLAQIEEICYDHDQPIHLPGVENILSSFRDTGYSLIFMVCGEGDRVRIYVGMSQFSDSPAMPITAGIEGLTGAWKGHFPGASLRNCSHQETMDISATIARSENCAVLTGIPSLKRNENDRTFVQGLERLIRSLRGKSYTWLSIADPVSAAEVDDSINACRNLITDTHHLVKTTLSESIGKSKTAMAGMFGMAGLGNTDGTAFSDMTSESSSHTEGKTQQHLEGYQRAASGLSAGATVVGSIVGTIIAPGLGTVIGGAIGGSLGRLVGGIGQAVTGKSGHAFSTADTLTQTRAFTNTASQAVARQVAGGGFGSFGMTWNRQSTITQEYLNRQAEYCEELLRKHEERLSIGRAQGMWNLGHYFCAGDSNTFSIGCGALRSLFSGMESQYEPPRMLVLPKASVSLMRRFANVYISFANNNLRNLLNEDVPQDKLVVASHPLGFFYNGLATPVNTRELAISTPLAVQEAEGITVSMRAPFGVNVPPPAQKKTIVVGTVLDRKDSTGQRLRLPVENLKKHVSIFGLTGSGKTNTVKHLLNQLWKNHRIPFMVIEPAKSEYQALSEMEDLKDDLVVFSAGREKGNGAPLRLNPFDFPASGKEAVQVLTHIDRLKSLFNASFPMYASMPYILEEAILSLYRERGWDLGQSRNIFVDVGKNTYDAYLPTLGDLYNIVDKVVERKGYWVEQQMNIRAALKARISSLIVGAKGPMLNCEHSLPDEALFNRPTIVELKNLGDDDEKTFVMGLLLTRLYEYRESLGIPTGNELPAHVLVIEEAHRLLRAVPEAAETMEVGNMRAKSVNFFADMLSEIRAYGQSAIVVDQLPSRLHPVVVKGTGTKIVHRLLAKDDREAVGHTMALNENQISDLSLLETGQCVIHQETPRQPFLCKVPLHRIGLAGEGKSGNGTKRFLEEYASCFQRFPGCRACSPACEHFGNVDEEDNQFAEKLRATMYILRFCNYDGIKLLLDRVVPRRVQNDPGMWQDKKLRLCWLSAYWDHLAKEMWAYYGGEYRSFVELKVEGDLLLQKYAGTFGGKLDAVRYDKTAAGFMITPRRPTNSCLECPCSCAFGGLVSTLDFRADLLDRIKKMSTSTRSDVVSLLATSIAGYVASLIPVNADNKKTPVVKNLVYCITAHVTDRTSVSSDLQAELVEHVLSVIGGR